MGRPLNKKFFGNRNIGTSGTSDDKIGGEGIASINWSQRGSWLATAGGASAPLAGLALPAPTLPGGVQATWTNYFGVAAVTTGAGKLGLVVGDTYEYTPIPGSVITVSDLSGANAVFTVNTAGSTTTLLTDTQTVSITKLTGAGVGTFTVDVFAKVVNTVINEKGSGYTGAETFTVTKVNGATGTAPAGTIVKTTDSGVTNGVNASDNQENAIIAYAWVDGGREVVDIVAQKGGKKYKVTGADGTVTALLVGAQASADGEMDIKATDSDGGTYWVTKLTSHKATLEPNTGTQFASGQRVKWNLTAAVEDESVVVENA